MRRLAAITVALGGCSWILMDKVPDKYEPASGEARCTAGQGAPGADLLLAAADIGTGVYLFAGYEKTARPAGVRGDNPFKLALTVGAVTGGLHILSAITGFGYSQKCREANASRDAYLAERDRVQTAVPVIVPADAGAVDAPVDASVDAAVDGGE
jgi:hypothetical protein